ncbi:hypothetical protein MKQ70_27715 [Chitinophaga sedimenti]|uniref:hypothetical protein n=1 Tax=Chitinophaga sedimenti TaxID=2033606 RepID=UPI002002F636|nr:hypothetical protein [Chitinophaga sedimenti]MCK7558578.1 hypothetical protein [Chitinophaga sedimenti]
MKFMPLLFVSLFAAVSLSAQQVDTTTKQQNRPYHHWANPLYLVNGVYTNGLNALEPKDITEVSVIKDSEGTKKYGDIADNGVILITTNKSMPAGVPLIKAAEDFCGQKLVGGIYMLDGRKVKADNINIIANAVKKIEISKKEDGICLNIITNVIEAPAALPSSPFKAKPGEIWIRGTASNNAPNNRD